MIFSPSVPQLIPSTTRVFTQQICFKMTAELETRIAASQARVTKVVFPNTTNHYDTLFGGTAMQLMDETAFIAATRFSRKKVVTISTGKIDFKEPIPADTIIELVAEVVRIGQTSLDVE